MLTDAELEELADRVRFDLTSAGFAPLPEHLEDAPEGGLLVFVDQDKVVVAWQVHTRLGDAALDMREIGHTPEDVVQRFEAVTAVMHLTLGSLLTAFGYSIRTPAFGHGIEIPTSPR
ncbi:hypothetical protein AB0H73_10120 [Streptomyces olivoreticuli]